MAEVLIYYTVLEDTNVPIDIKHIHALPKILADEIILYKQQGDINRLTAGKYLLKKALGDLGFDKNLLATYKIDENEKPFIEGFHPFNITHSGKVVACAVLLEKGNIGIDVEKIREIDPGKFDKQFSAPEMMQILSSKDPGITFFEYWTMKEAVMKADGRGMKIPLHDIKLRRAIATIDGLEMDWNLYPLQLHESVKSHVCSDKKLEKIEAKKWKWEELYSI